ncbi:hypothetical protein M408DRAFT_326640 [Serendipita vermifera MAFF 305830]|uniref:Decapping nuclease n=1 Tax=Serendipita vermifera MAFF 305830 TaxID=933852 RepID=A0A0C3BLL1_SERVB|nr:hypothetical protein M408DRAFT_326640 [Serendipita vermifera MAFF 305830]
MSLHKNLSKAPLKSLVAPLDVPSVPLEGFSTLASFSWINSPEVPTLAIPGDPPKWIEPQLPLRLPQDQGTRYIDHTGDQCEKANVSRLMPLFQSVEHCAPSFDFKELNLICNRNNLRNLLRWIEGRPKKDFRIDLHLVNDNNTLVMLQYEIEFTEYVSLGQFRGYGDNFRKKTVRFPSAQVKHNRVVTYRFGQFRVLMTHKVEAHVENRDYDDNLESLMSSLSVQDATENTTKSKIVGPDSLPVRRTADKVKEYEFIEIKTMAQRKPVDWAEFYPQIYLSQTKLLYAALHSRGEFVTIDKYKTDDLKLVEYKKSMEKSLGQLVEFLRRLVTSLKAVGNGPWALVCVEGNMTLHDSTDATLPDVILSKF